MIRNRSAFIMCAWLTMSCSFILPSRADVIGGPLVNPANDHVYYLLSENSWTNSEAEAVLLGGHLTSILDSNEEAWVFNNFATLGGTNHYLWIGLTDQASEGTFGWTTGEPVNFTHWASGEPNNGSSDWVYITSPAELNDRVGFWNDRADDTALNAVAEIDCGIVAVCSFTPAIATNNLAAAHTATATITSNGVPLANATVFFNVTAGPNTGDNSSGQTDNNGEIDFVYTGDGGVGTDTIQATGTVGCASFSCSATKTWVEAPDDGVHDFAIIKMKAPKNVNLQGAAPSLNGLVVVTIQNRSPHDETIANLNLLNELVHVTVDSLGECPNLEANLIDGPPNVVPRTLKPKQKLNVFFQVTFSDECVNDPDKGSDHEDYRYMAVVNHAAIDGNADTHTVCDTCPRPPLPGGVDPNPDADKPLKDKGCGNKNKETGQIGADIVTDVSLKED